MRRRLTRTSVGAMQISTGSLAVAGARHPWRAISAWLAATVLAIAAIATLLGGLPT